MMGVILVPWRLLIIGLLLCRLFLQPAGGVSDVFAELCLVVDGAVV
jgi:hypothetical protein